MILKVALAAASLWLIVALILLSIEPNTQVSHEQTYCFDKYQSGLYYPCRDIHEYEGEA